MIENVHVPPVLVVSVNGDIIYRRYSHIFIFIKKNNENQRVPAKTRANIHYKRSSLHELLTYTITTVLSDMKPCLLLYNHPIVLLQCLGFKLSGYIEE